MIDSQLDIEEAVKILRSTNKDFILLIKMGQDENGNHLIDEYAKGNHAIIMATLHIVLNGHRTNMGMEPL